MAALFSADGGAVEALGSFDSVKPRAFGALRAGRPRSRWSGTHAFREGFARRLVHNAASDCLARSLNGVRSSPHRFHRRAGDSRLARRRASGGNCAARDCEAVLVVDPDQPSLRHRHAEHAGVDDAQHRALRPGLRAWPDRAVRSSHRPSLERRAGERERAPDVDPLRLHAGGRQRGVDGETLGGADSPDAEGARLRREYAGRRPGRHP